MLFYVFLLFMYLPNMVFLMISWMRTPNHIPKSGIWFASHSYGLETNKRKSTYKIFVSA